MNFLTASHTDVGRRKEINQDSMILMQAQTEKGNVLFASVCDGMGGLDKGEAASAAMVKAFADWFENSLPELLKGSGGQALREEELRESWSALMGRTSRAIESYGRGIHAALGTTAAGVLIIGEDYYTFNVGDSRVYLLADRIYQLTKDQTYVQRELDAGRMTCEESRTHPWRNVLLQCIGAGPLVKPAYGHGRALAGTAFLLCSDGFRHEVSQEEFYRAFHPARLTDERAMKQGLEEMTRLNMERGELDNISAILIRLL